MKTIKDYKTYTFIFVVLMWMANIPMYFVTNPYIDMSLYIIWVIVFIGTVVNGIKWNKLLRQRDREQFDSERRRQQRLHDVRVRRLKKDRRTHGSNN